MNKTQRKQLSFLILLILLGSGCSGKTELNIAKNQTLLREDPLDKSLFELLPHDYTQRQKLVLYPSEKKIDKLEIKKTGTPEYWSFHRYHKKLWWIVYRDPKGEKWGKISRAKLIPNLTRSLQTFQQINSRESYNFQTSYKIDFFTKNNRYSFTLIIPKADNANWLIYRRGALYRQNSKSKELKLFFSRLKATLRQSGLRRDWLHLPLNGASLPLDTLINYAKYLKKRQQTLKRCFTKRRFPSKIGPLKILLTFGPDGKLEDRKIETRAHTQYRVVWCPWWNVKFWKLTPAPKIRVHYRLLIPPGGPQ